MIDLRPLCCPERSDASRPYVRSFGGKVYTCAAGGAALLAVRGVHADKSFPGPECSFMPHFKWRDRRSVRWAPLKRYLTETATRTDGLRYPVSVHGVTIDAGLAVRYLRDVGGSTVELRTSKVLHEGKPNCLRIDGRGWLALIMAMTLEPLDRWRP